MKNITPAILICLSTLCHAQSTPAVNTHPSSPSIDTRGGGCDTIGFDPYTTNEIIGEQYLNCGVVFENAMVHDYGEATYGKIIHGSSDWYDSLVVHLVQPNDASTPRPVQHFSFDNVVDPNISTEVDYVTVRCYDINNTLVASASNTSASRTEIVLSAPLIVRVVIDDSASTAYALDDFVFDGPSITGVSSVHDTPAITVFPDPVMDELQVQGLNSTTTPLFLITDVNGRVVLRPVAVREGAMWRLDLRGLRAGAYFLHMHASGWHNVQRVIKN